MYDRLASRRYRPVTPPSTNRCTQLSMKLSNLLSTRVLVGIIIVTSCLLISVVVFHINTIRATTAKWERIPAATHGRHCSRGRCREKQLFFNFDLLEAESATAPQSADALSSVKATTTKQQQLAGPLCVFVPTTPSPEQRREQIHRNETIAFLESWADNSTVLFSDSFEHLMHHVGSNDTARALADLKSWTDWHTAVITERSSLRRRGATVDSLRGRGQLSIPLFHWISQLVKRNHPLVQNCKWFMKCDTDTYLRRHQLEKNTLNKLNHSERYHVGVPLSFNTHPYQHSARHIFFDYNIGGPGYTFSRGLMAAVDTIACVKSMALDPVLLIHDDVATGYCAHYFASSAVRVDVDGYVASSAHRIVSQLLAPIASLKNTSNETSAVPVRGGAFRVNGTVWHPRHFSHRHRSRIIDYELPVQRSNFSFTATVKLRDDVSCLDQVHALHPVTANVMRLLARRDREISLLGKMHSDDMLLPPANCTVKLMAGQTITVGSGWVLDDTLSGITNFWLQLWDRRRYQSYYGQSFRLAGEALDILLKG